jgi:hypothetical protein
LNHPTLIVVAAAAAAVVAVAVAVAVEKKTLIIVEDYIGIFDIDSHSTRLVKKKKK